MRDFRELKVWEKSHQLALDTYRATAGFPKEETYRLTSQMRRAAVSIPANIAEGCGKNGAADFARPDTRFGIRLDRNRMRLVL